MLALISINSQLTGAEKFPTVYIYIGKSHSLIHIFNNYRRTKCQTIV